MGAREEIARAYTAGAAAGRAGEDVLTCPHGPETLLRPAWVRGYVRGERARKRAAEGDRAE